MKNSLVIIKATYGELSTIISFLSHYECSCASLMARVLKCYNEKSIIKQTIYVIKEKSLPFCVESINGVFLITSAGVVLHHVLSNDIQPLLKQIFHNKSLFSIAGTEDGSISFEAALNNKPTTVNNYHIMTFDNKKREILLSNTIKNPFCIKKCSLSDIKNLFELQMLYQIEEVLPPGKSISEKACRDLIKSRLIDHTVFAIVDTLSDNFVAMAGTNAIGVNCIQLGGIFTKKSYRNKGLAQNLLRSLVFSFDKEISLFVRKENFPAIKAYSNVGFKIIGSYRICYI